jgi:hypothetical protein
VAVLPEEDSNLHCPVQSRVSYQLDDQGMREHPGCRVPNAPGGRQRLEILGRVPTAASTTQGPVEGALSLSASSWPRWALGA